jgi:CheY-like chemotaxis protein
MASEPYRQLVVPISTSFGMPPLRLNGLHVLLVDDDTDHLALLSELLSDAGADVTAVSSAHEAVRALARHTIDVIVSDINMPDCDGYHLLRMIRARTGPQGGETPAIALTCLGTDGDRARAQLAGYQMHLVKPIRLVELIVAIREVVNARTGSIPGDA